MGGGRVPVAVSTDTEFNTVEKIGGEKTITYTPSSTIGATTLTAAQSGVPAHSHGLNGHTHSIGAHSHGLNSHVHSVAAHAHGLNSHTHGTTDYYANTSSGSTALVISQIPSHSHRQQMKWNYNFTVAVGGGAGISNIPTAGYDYELAATGGSGRYSPAHWISDGICVDTATTGSGGGHTHTVSNTYSSRTSGAVSGNTANSTAFNSGAASDSTANNSAFNSGGPSTSSASNDAVSASASHTHTVSGMNTIINNIQPYITCYMWKRTA